MNRLAALALALAVTLAVAGCGGGATSAYARRFAAAERAYGAGRYGEAAGAWKDAAGLAATARDRDEALYRRAASFARQGNAEDERRALDELIKRSPKGERSARALLDRGKLSQDGGNIAGALADFDEVVVTHSDSGVAPEALAREVSLLGDRGEPAVILYLEARLRALADSELGQYLHAALAASLERSGDLKGARARYLLVAERYPYPTGALWDDALFHAAEISARLGDPKDAIATLDRMLAEREHAYLQGSYERGRYGEAQFRVAELYRDALNDPARARAAFERLWSAHRTSRLRDDAAWNAAKIAVASGDHDGACADLRALVTEMPESRYAPCASRLCPALPAPRSGDCHEYVLRQGEGR